MMATLKFFPRNGPLLGLIGLLGVALRSATACSRDHADRVGHLPGYDAPLPTPWFSGYLDYTFEGQAMHTHYTLVLAEDDDGDDSKPLIYWSNGGPGASSLFGLLTELGPLLLSDLSLQTEAYRTSGVPTPLYNHYTWARLGTLLVFDQPAPVGFSYCNNGTSGHACGDIAWTDELTSANAYRALQAFYDKFPCHRDRDLYLVGESYAGIYIPTLARRILQGAPDLAARLRGFAVGDGCLGTQTGICGELADNTRVSQLWDILFLAGHGQLPIKTFKTVLRECHHHIVAADGTETQRRHRRLSDACGQALEAAYDQAGGFFAYGLYDDCTYRNGLLQGRHGRTPGPGVAGALNDYACGGGVVMLDYLNRSDVKLALHVRGDFFETDNAEGDFDYTPTEPDLTGFYREVNGRIRVLVYNGDADPAINSFAAENWTSGLGLPELEPWRPWTIDGCRRMGGYVTRYQGDFDFLTIRGAGHMVPTNKAAASMVFLKSWIRNMEYPRYLKDCESPPALGPWNETRNVRTDVAR